MKSQGMVVILGNEMLGVVWRIFYISSYIIFNYIITIISGSPSGDQQLAFGILY